MVLPTLDSYLSLKKLTNSSQTETDNNNERSKSANTVSKSTRPGSTQSKWLSPITGLLNDEALRFEQEKEDKRKHLSEVLQPEKNEYQDSSRMADESSFEELSLDNLPLNDSEQEEKQTNREIRIVQLKIILQQQMNEIKRIEQELESFKQEEESLLKERNQLDQYHQDRKQIQKPSVQQDSTRQLLRQHKAKLHKRAKEIQEQLDFDIKYLRSIVYPDEQTRARLFEEQDRFRRDLLKILKQFEQQMNLEKEKEIQFDNMYQDEAAKQWSVQEHEWNNQMEAREKRIEQLLDQRQEEIVNRLQMLKEQTKEIRLKQQTLINDMEQARKYQLIEKQKQINEKEQNRQISTLQQHQTSEDHHTEQIEHFEQKKEPISSEKTVEPKFYGRRRVNWN